MSRQNLTLAERPYHHGDLQRAMVRAALEALSESQSTDFSLRELARRAGVSHNAPYKHFADKRKLLEAISAEGFELLAKRITDATKRLRNPRARLAAMGRDYVRHGVEKPALYRLMFGGYPTGPDDGPPAIERAAVEKTSILRPNLEKIERNIKLDGFDREWGIPFTGLTSRIYPDCVVLR